MAPACKFRSGMAAARFLHTPDWRACVITVERGRSRLIAHLVMLADVKRALDALDPLAQQRLGGIVDDIGG